MPANALETFCPCLSLFPYLSLCLFLFLALILPLLCCPFSSLCGSVSPVFRVAYFLLVDFIPLPVFPLCRVAYFVLVDFIPLPVFAKPEPDVTELTGDEAKLKIAQDSTEMMGCMEETYGAGHHLIVANTQATCFYVLLSGRVKTVCGIL